MAISFWGFIIVLGVALFLSGAALAIVAVAKRKDQE